jgi:uncharacterized protein with von Willebrand factor type A (vWA) domain
MNAHYASSDSVTGAILRFTHMARQKGLNVGLQEAQEALEIGALGLIANKRAFRYALKAIFCCTEDDGVVFDSLFDTYWQHLGDEDPRIHYQKDITYADNQGSLALMGHGEGPEESISDTKTVSGASRTERLRKTDFAKVAEVDAAFLEEIIAQLVRQLSMRLKKRYKRDRRGIVHMRATIRHSISRGGTFVDLIRKYKKKQKFRLVVLLDVSGSMDKYSFYLLRFAWALRSRFQSVETFVFSTTLVRVSDVLSDGDIGGMLASLSRVVHNWSSGTRIGDCLYDFNRKYGKRVLNGRSIVIILSDGLDTGEPELLTEQLEVIRRRTKKIIWLNPLKGMEGYAPEARGMRAALPEVDTFASAHNLDSLLKLESFLADV